MTTTPKVKRFYWKWHVELGLAVVFVGLVILGVVLFATRGEVAREVRRGNQAHIALCAQRADLQGRIRQNLSYLAMTPAQRVKAFGPALGAVPASTVRASIVNYKRTIKSYQALRC